MDYPLDEVLAAAKRLQAAFVEAEERNTWAWIADELYHEDATYFCPYGGAMPVLAKSRDEIRATHYGRDMDVGSGWAGWSFPITHIAVDGNQIITRWVNRGPGVRPDGSFYETHGVSWIIDYKYHKEEHNLNSLALNYKNQLNRYASFFNDCNIRQFIYFLKQGELIEI